MSGIILPMPRPITQKERNELTLLKDRLVVEAICRKTGRTDWDFSPVFFARGNWVQYIDGCEVFTWDGEELFLMHELSYDLSDNKYKRRYEYLFNYKDYEHHTAEDEAG